MLQHVFLLTKYFLKENVRSDWIGSVLHNEAVFDTIETIGLRLEE